MQIDETLINNYLDNLAQVIRAIPRESLLKCLEVLILAREKKKRVYIFGNGGSASTASHIACDFEKNTRRPNKPPFRAIALNNMPTFSAYANDMGYENVFSEPLQSLAESGDIAIAVSGSGNSPNVLQAIKVARKLGLITIGLTGFAGGKLKDLVDICLIVPSDCMEIIEDSHLIIDHILTVMLRNPDLAN